MLVSASAASRHPGPSNGASPALCWSSGLGGRPAFQSLPTGDLLQARPFPIASHHCVLEVGEQASPIVVVPDDDLPGIAACHHVLDGTPRIRSSSSWPAAIGSGQRPDSARAKHQSEPIVPPGVGKSESWSCRARIVDRASAVKHGHAEGACGQQVPATSHGPVCSRSISQRCWWFRTSGPSRPRSRPSEPLTTAPVATAPGGHSGAGRRRPERARTWAERAARCRRAVAAGTRSVGPRS